MHDKSEFAFPFFVFLDLFGIYTLMNFQQVFSLSNIITFFAIPAILLQSVNPTQKSYP